MAKYCRDVDDGNSDDNHRVFGSGSSSSSSPSPSPSPCGACKFLRRKCVADCIFAPYFWCEQGPATFAAIHKVFGASNVSKLLLHVPVPHRCEAVLTIAYEAHARIHDPVYGCLSHLFALQQQVAYLQTQLMQAKAQLAQTLSDESGGNMEIQWTSANSTPIPSYPNNYQTHIMNSQIINSPQTSLQSAPTNNDHEAALFMINFQQSQTRSYQEPQFQQLITKNKSPSNSHAHVGDLQALALTMMRN